MDNNKPRKRSFLDTSSILRPKSKRVKIERKPFMFDDDTPVPVVTSPKKRKPATDKTVQYKRGAYLAIRTDDDEFYLCQATQIVYTTSNVFKIRWLTKTLTPDVYFLDYCDNTELECVICKVKMEKHDTDQFRLSDREKEKIRSNLQEALELGDDSDEENDKLNSAPIKRVKKGPRNNKTKRDKPVVKGRNIKTTASKQKVKNLLKVFGLKKTKKSSVTGKPVKSTKIDAKKDPNKKLQPNSRVKVWQSNPFLDAKDMAPFISTSVQSKLLFRAIHNKDYKLLQTLIKDTDHVATLDQLWSPANYTLNPMSLAIQLNDVKAIELLGKAKFDVKVERVAEPKTILEMQSTGCYNPVSLGIRVVRTIEISRGSREGNKALLKDVSLYGPNDSSELSLNCITKGAQVETMRKVYDLFSNSNTKENLRDTMSPEDTEALVVRAVEYGQRKAAGELMKYLVANGLQDTTNFLHHDVLVFDKQDLRPSLREASVRKKTLSSKVTPVHFAAINPNTKYLSRLMSIVPEYDMPDGRMRRPLHYAAVCEGTGPLQYLLDKGVNPDHASSEGRTALHYACLAGRAKNVEVLMKRAEAGKKNSDENMLKKFGLGCINKADRSSYTPLFLAIEGGHVDCAIQLLKYDVDLKKTLSAGKEKVSALMYACQRDQLDIVKLLVEHGAKVEQTDKLSRTALIHAIMNGQAHIASYLLSLGSNPDQADSSGNTALHYAVAYGWYHCTKVLFDAGVKDNVPNNWKITPVMAAYMKGHYGLVDLLLERPSVDINFRDEKGMTLLLLTCSSPLDAHLLDQVQYLLKKNIDVTLSDTGESNALHYLASNSLLRVKRHWREPESIDPAKMELSFKLSSLLIDKGCDAMATNNAGDSPLMCALKNNNTDLVQLLVEKGASISEQVGSGGKTILHTMSESCMRSDMSSVIDVLVKQEDTKSALTKMAAMRDHVGCTPLLQACIAYKEYKEDSSFTPDGVEVKDTKWQLARQFMDCLIILLNADINATVGEKHFVGIRPEKESERYTEYGKRSAVHILSSVSNEPNHVTEESTIERPALQMVLNYKPDLDQMDIKGYTPLVLAYKNKNLSSFQLLLKAGARADIPSANEDDHAAPPIILASKEGSNYLPFLIEVLKYDDKVNVRDDYQNTALCYACNCRSLEAVQLLLDHNANVNIKNSQQWTPLHWAIRFNNGGSDVSTEIEELLIEHGADVFAANAQDRLPLHITFRLPHESGIKGNHYDPIELCTTLTGAMKGDRIDVPDIFGRTPLHRAALVGASICCMHLLAKGASLQAVDNDGNTPLAVAALNNQMSCVLILMEKDANINVTVYDVPYEDEKKEKSEKPAWRWSVLKTMDAECRKKTRSFPLVQSIIYHEWQGILYIMLDKLNQFCLPYTEVVEAAMRTSKFNLVLTLLKKVPDIGLLTQTNSKGQNLFHILALSASVSMAALVLKVAGQLVRYNVPVDASDSCGCTPLIYACLHHNAALVNFLLERVSIKTLNEKDKYGRNALAAVFWHLDPTCYKDALSIAESLVKEGLTLNLLCDYPDLDPAHFDQPPDGATVLPRLSRYHRTYDTSTSPLIKLLHQRDGEMTRYLASMLSIGASADFADESGMTPLMYAIKLNNVHAVKLLLNHFYRPPTDEELRKQQQMEEAKQANNKSKKMIQLGQIVEAAAASDDESESDDEDNMDVDDEGEEEDEVDGDQVKVDRHLMEVTPSGDIDMNYDSFTKTSNVQLTTKDKDGHTALHHLVSPLHYGSYDNLEILKVLVDSGMPLMDTDGAGLNALDYALIRGVPKLSRGLQKCLGRETDTWDPPTLQTPEVSDGITNLGPKPDYQADANSLLKEIRKDEADIIEYTPSVDSLAENIAKNAGEIVWDTMQTVAYDVLLTKVDVKHGFYGTYNFYKMQIIWLKGKDLYFLFTRWGRIGDDGQYQCTPFPKREETVKEFEKVFKQKTSNDWANYKTFEHQPGKYRLVHQEQKAFRTNATDLPLTFDSDVPSQLPDALQGFMKDLTSITSLTKATETAGFKGNHLPFGDIRRDDLIRAFKVLQTIRQHVEDIEDSDEPMNDSEKTKTCELIAELSNEYYHLIPQHGFTYESLSPLDDESVLQNESRLVNSLLDYEMASQMMIAAQFRVKEVNPLDYVYRCMDCQIKLLDQNDTMTQYILKYIHSTSPGVKVEGIFGLSRPGQNTALSSAGLENHVLLWHGSSPENLISILSRGLLIAPPEVDHTGHMFGKGIYFADTFCKSKNYCHNYDPCSKTMYMLLCEVGLGQVNAMTYPDENSKAPDKFDSVMGIGRQIPNPVYNVTLPTGAVIPLGSLINRPGHVGLDYNEYIIYRENQVAIRYVVQFRTQ